MSTLENLMIAVSSANNIDITRDCLKSIPPGPRVVIYDDASTEPIKKLCSEFKVGLYKEDRPKGLTNLWNRAYADFLKSGLKSVIITNNDVIFPKGSIEEMVKVFNEQGPIILGPLTNKPGTGKNQRVSMYLCLVDTDPNDPRNAQTIQDMLLFSMTKNFLGASYINGFCFMVDRTVDKYRYDAAHLFPPQKINIGNEDWLCGQVHKKSKNKGGFIICLTSFVFHYKGLTTRWCKKTSTKKGVNRENLWREL